MELVHPHFQLLRQFTFPPNLSFIKAEISALTPFCIHPLSIITTFFVFLAEFIILVVSNGLKDNKSIISDEILFFI